MPAEAAMTAHFLRNRDFSHSASLDWLLILIGTLFAWCFWPAQNP